MTHFIKTIESPVGALRLVATQRGLAAVLWADDPPGRVTLNGLTPAPEHAILCDTACQLERYFAGSLQAFDVPLDAAGTEFQKRVWEALVAIPFGQTRSYGQIARRLGKPQASRAVGAANAKNPISIIVPCHRVVGSNGSLTGFAGGLAIKRRLLALESQAELFAGPIDAKRLLNCG